MSAEAPKSSTSLVLMALNSSVRLVKGITCSSINGRISLRFSGLVYKVCTSYNRDKGLHPASHLQIHQGRTGTLIRVRNESRTLCLLSRWVCSSFSHINMIVFTLHFLHFIAWLDICFYNVINGNNRWCGCLAHGWHIIGTQLLSLFA